MTPDHTAPVNLDEPIALTGERTAPGIPDENYWFQRHVVAYEYAARLVSGAAVLDAGCGEGYGTDLLAARATSVTGVDINAAIVRRAAVRYPRARFQLAELTALPFADASFGAVVSLQVIEHLPSPAAFLAECARVLEPGGLLMISTPNRLTFSPHGLRNPFHIVEFSPEELRAAVAECARDVEMLGTFHAAGIGTGTAFPEQLIAQPPREWSPALRARVAQVSPSDFHINARDLDESLDLITIARR